MVTQLTRIEWLAAKNQLPVFIKKRMVTLYQCEECQMAFTSKTTMLEHLNDTHTTTEGDNTDEVPGLQT